MISLNAALVQSTLFWEQPKQNCELFEQIILQLKPDAEIVILPEMFSTGFTMNTSFAESMDGETVQWMKKMALSYQKCIAGSLMIHEEGVFHNRFIWVFPNGTVEHYDKRHLFGLANEHESFSAGTNQQVIVYKGWKIALAVCYDLRFPVWLRRTPDFDYDALIVVANWPEKRIAHWRALLQARAIENQSYVLGVNRVGTDGNQIYYNGLSGAVSPQGIWIEECEGEEKVLYISLDSNELHGWRNAFPAANDADSFNLA